jgi:hypothetical protein
VDEGAGVARHLPNEAFELAIVVCPLFDFRDQRHRHIERAGAAARLEGQVPAGLGTARSFKGRETAFEERTDLRDLAEGRRARAGVSVGQGRGGVHGGSGTGEISTGVPGSGLEGLADQLAKLFFQGPITGDALAAFAGLGRGESLGGAFSLQEAGPAVIGAVELGRVGLAGAAGFAAGAPGGGEAAGQEREGDLEGDFSCLHIPNVYIH